MHQVSVKLASNNTEYSKTESYILAEKRKYIFNLVSSNFKYIWWLG